MTPNKLLYISCSLLLIACSSPANQEEELRAVAGSYLGSIKLGEHEVEINLQLYRNGFYQFAQSYADSLELPLERDAGVYLLREDQLDLARNKPGIRYFKWIDGALIVLNDQRDYFSYPEDSAFYLPRRVVLPDSIF